MTTRLPLFSVLPLVALLASGCASGDAADGARADESELREGGVCSTLDYGHTIPNDTYFLPFETDAAVMEYAKDFLATASKPPAKEVSKDARLLQLVDEVYAGFRKVFPRETAGLERPPRVVIVDSPEINAFAGFDDRPTVKKAPWLFFVHQAIIDRTMTDSQLRGLFAHELAHLILRNVLPETRAKIRVHYRVRDGKEAGVLGAMADDDPALAARAAKIRHLGDKIGRFSAFGPLPVGLLSEPEYQFALAGFSQQRESSAHPEACQAGDEALGTLSALAGPHVSSEDFTLTLSASEGAEVTRLAGQVATSMRTCYGHVKASLYELKVRGRFGKLPPEIGGPMLKTMLDPTTPEHAEAFAEIMTDEIEKRLDAEGDGSAVERFLKVVETMRAELTALETEQAVPVEEIRIFDMEEDADDAAVRVLHAIGDDPLGIATFLTTLLAKPDACTTSIQAGKVPAYGGFIDPHNGTCYRVYHAGQMAKALAVCAEKPARARAAKGSGVGSADDKRPTELLEKGHKRGYPGTTL